MKTTKTNMTKKSQKPRMTTLFAWAALAVPMLALATMVPSCSDSARVQSRYDASVEESQSSSSNRLNENYQFNVPGMPPMPRQPTTVINRCWGSLEGGSDNSALLGDIPWLDTAGDSVIQETEVLETNTNSGASFAPALPKGVEHLLAEDGLGNKIVDQSAARAHAPASAGVPLSQAAPSRERHGALEQPNNEQPSRPPAPTLTLRATDELLVIERRIAPDEFPAHAAPRDDDRPGCGSMLTQFPGQPAFVPVPLKHTDVRARITGLISAVDVVQQFANPFSEKIEAVYVFPLPENAAVCDFVMTIGERRIRGIIREREEARRVYEQAKSQGYTASLLSQERPNIFTQRVANIEPGKSIDVSIRYFSTLSTYDGWGEFVFPMVVGPRFNPPGTTDGVAAMPRTAPGQSGQETEVQYLRPSERSGHDISLAVEIDAGMKVEEVVCRTHAIDTNSASGNGKSVRLLGSGTIPNRDFVLRFRLAGENTKSGIVTYRDEKSGESYFQMMIVPPADLQRLQRAPIELVLVLDSSGSMSGRPIEQAKLASQRILNYLQPSDTFQVIDFSDTASALGPVPLAASRENVRRGLDYLNTLGAGGGTMMINGIRASLGFVHDPQRTRYVAFLTDGFIGNEPEIITEVDRALGNARLFSFGVGSAPNRFLMDRLAKLGRGVAAYVNLNDNPEQVIDLFMQRIAHPALADIRVDWNGASVTDVYPRRIPDVFAGRPVMITGKLTGEWRGSVKLVGRAGGREITLPISSGNRRDTKSDALAAVWARAKIADLSDQFTVTRRADLPNEILATALRHNLLSDFTSFLAVDSLHVTSGSTGVTIANPVPVPDGVRYDTTVNGSPIGERR